MGEIDVFMLKLVIERVLSFWLRNTVWVVFSVLSRLNERGYLKVKACSWLVYSFQFVVGSGILVGSGVGMGALVGVGT